MMPVPMLPGLTTLFILPAKFLFYTTKNAAGTPLHPQPHLSAPYNGCPLGILLTLAVLLYWLFPSQFTLTLSVPTAVSPYIGCLNLTAPLHWLSPLELHLALVVPITGFHWSIPV